MREGYADKTAEEGATGVRVTIKQRRRDSYAQERDCHLILAQAAHLV